MPGNPGNPSKVSCGRPRVRRCVELNETPGCYAPVCPRRKANIEMVTLYPEEIAVLKLVDLEGLSQEDAAGVMGVSRKTAWRDLHDARFKLADALVNGKILKISCCPHTFEGVHPDDCRIHNEE
ncbi:MAG TPA: DUF134 domain-containing protein [Methanocorpusculum sp.]|nr:DUF134 domain-containing protein [Methanocorpusculum sp.]HJJ54091.1 DUF134 domain-containing protein [Methanocorpusculum sp.]